MTHYLRRALLAVILLTVVLATACAAPDSNDSNRLQSAGVMRVGTEGVYAPFSYHDESGQLVVMARQVVNGVASESR